MTEPDPVFVRPGPAKIDPGEAVGGIVVHIYGVPDCVLVHVGKLGGFLSPTQMEAVLVDDVAVAVAKVGGRDEVCIVAYDGDSGERLSHWPDPWN